MTRFKEIFRHKQEILRNRPDKCRVEVSAESRLVELFRSHVRTRDFEVVIDQPDNMGSTDRGPRPSEILLAALAASLTTPLALAQHGSQPMHRHFGDAERWSQVFDDPARDQWQKPDQVIAALALAPELVVSALED